MDRQDVDIYDKYKIEKGFLLKIALMVQVISKFTQLIYQWQQKRWMLAATAPALTTQHNLCNTS